MEKAIDLAGWLTARSMKLRVRRRLGTWRARLELRSAAVCTATSTVSALRAVENAVRLVEGPQ